MMAWIDSGSPFSIFTIGELKTTLGQTVKNYTVGSKDEQFCDYGTQPVEVHGEGEGEADVKWMVGGDVYLCDGGIPPANNWTGFDAI